MEKLISYSQHGEDDLIWKTFSRKKDGLIVEVGAFDGIHLSNSYALTKHGWKAICVEPHPKYFPLLTKNRPESTLINAAVVGDENIKSIELEIEPLGLLSGAFLDEADIKKRYENRGLLFPGLEKVEVPARTLNSILSEFMIEKDSIDCISIDVEGFEMEVLKGTDLKKYQPKMLIIEANSKAYEKMIISYMKSLDYVLARKIEVNLIFCQNSILAKKVESVKIDCIKGEQRHPLGEEYTTYIYTGESNLHRYYRMIIGKVKKILSIR